ncbi:MAG: gamma-glutamylcyclotransferase family protein [Nocardioides sp.]
MPVGRLARVWAAPMPLFVYGSLLFPEVMEVLIGRNPRRRPAAVDDWRVVGLPGEVYPGLVSSPGSTASGELLCDLTGSEWEVLDAFENDIYDLAVINSRALGADVWAYVVADVLDYPVEWDARGFADNQLPEYLRRCAQWRSRHLGRQ